MCHGWPVNKSIVNLPITLKGNSKRISGNSLSILGAWNKDMGTSLQTLYFKQDTIIPYTRIQKMDSKTWYFVVLGAGDC